MRYTRREMGRLALAVPAAGLMPAMLAAQGKPDSKFAGVQVGVIGPYAFQGTARTAEEILKSCVELGISAIELQNDPVEAYAGAPQAPRRPGGPGGPPPSAGARPQPTPEEPAERERFVAAPRAWRARAPTETFAALAKTYRDAGVSIYAFKLQLTDGMTDAEIEYPFRVAKALGASQVTMELPTSGALTRRIGDVAARHRIWAGYHNHAQATFTLWDEALSQSPYNGVNLDIGHYVAGTSESPVPFIRKHHARITSIHVKDRKKGNGENMPWGQGDTPIREVLQLMKQERYTFPATIELEYRVDGSNAMAELKKCVAYCKDALAGS